jgi:sugar phosphate permease
VTTDSAASPTRVRFLVIGLCFAMSVLLYLDRFALTPITSTLLAELKLDEEQLGRAVGAFFLVYAFFQVPAGWLSDTLGARRTLALYVVLWSLATIGLGLAGGLLAISLMRMVLGATQAGAYPAAASLLKRWVPLSGRGRANSLVSMGGRAGNLSAQFLTPLLVAAVAGWLGWSTGSWRVVLAAYGTLGVLWAVFFVWLYRDSPRQHPWCNAAERELIGEQPVPSGQPKFGYFQQLLTMLLSPNVWLMCLLGVSVNIGWVFLVTWLPRFLIAKHGAALGEYVTNREVLAGSLTALVGFSGMLGSISGGATTDRLVAACGRKWGRRLPGALAGVVVLGLYLLATQLSNVWVIVGLMIAISFTIDFGLGATWASYQDIGGRYVASVLGIGNMCGNLGAAYFGWYIGVLAKGGNWNQVFLISGCAMAFNACCWLLLDVTKTAVREESA